MKKKFMEGMMPKFTCQENLDPSSYSSKTPMPI